jgi:hypothetical protein
VHQWVAAAQLTNFPACLLATVLSSCSHFVHICTTSQPQLCRQPLCDAMRTALLCNCNTIAGSAGPLAQDKSSYRIRVHKQRYAVQQLCTPTLARSTHLPMLKLGWPANGSTFFCCWNRCMKCWHASCAAEKRATCCCPTAPLTLGCACSLSALGPRTRDAASAASASTAAMPASGLLVLLCCVDG